MVYFIKGTTSLYSLIKPFPEGKVTNKYTTFFKKIK